MEKGTLDGLHNVWIPGCPPRTVPLCWSRHGRKRHGNTKARGRTPAGIQTKHSGNCSCNLGNPNTSRLIRRSFERVNSKKIRAPCASCAPLRPAEVPPGQKPGARRAYSTYGPYHATLIAVRRLLRVPMASEDLRASVSLADAPDVHRGPRRHPGRGRRTAADQGGRGRSAAEGRPRRPLAARFLRPAVRPRRGRPDPGPPADPGQQRAGHREGPARRAVRPHPAARRGLPRLLAVRPAGGPDDQRHLRDPALPRLRADLPGGQQRHLRRGGRAADRHPPAARRAGGRAQPAAELRDLQVRAGLPAADPRRAGPAGRGRHRRRGVRPRHPRRQGLRPRRVPRRAVPSPSPPGCARSS